MQRDDEFDRQMDINGEKLDTVKKTENKEQNTRVSNWRERARKGTDRL